jgi:hypothetical protein
MRKRFIVIAVAATSAVALTVGGVALANNGGGTTATVEPAVLDDSNMKPSFTTIGGATVLPTTKTVAHWWGSSLDPTNGVTYGYNMVGADPNNCSGSACSTTIETDIIPINVTLGSFAFNGSDVVAATLASPQFANNDYTSTSAASDVNGAKGPGGALSSGNTNVQLEDATMRSQFNKTGSSSYHVILHPVVHDVVNIDVAGNHGVVLQSGRGVLFGDVEVTWWASQLQNLLNSLHIDPTHLPIFLTNSVMLYSGKNPANCCIIGFHGAGKVPGSSNGDVVTNGNAPVATYAWASYVTPGIFRPTSAWALQDIHGLSHEIAEWGDDPFVNNYVNPWLTPTAPQYGCTGILETGDPVVAIGVSVGTNTFMQGPAPNGQQIADGTFHPEDEVFLPWFVRQAPNTTSQLTQSPSTNLGRYTLMGDLNPHPGFRQPATGC